MAIVEIKDILASGDISDIAVSGNIQYTKASAPETEDMFMRIGTNGLTSLYRAPDQDVHWEDSDSTQQTVDTVATEILSIVVDQELTSNDSSWSITMRLDNTSNQNRIVNIVVVADGTSTDPVSYDLLKNEIDKQVLLSGNMSGTVASGSTISVEVVTDGTGVELRGDLLLTKLKVTKAQSAPVVATTSIDINRVYDTYANLGNALSKSEIEDVLIANGVAVFTKNEAFFIRDGAESLFMVTYLIDTDSYNSSKKMPKAT